MKPKETMTDGKLYCCCGKCGLIITFYGWTRDNKPVQCKVCKTPIDWDDYLNEKDEIIQPT